MSLGPSLIVPVTLWGRHPPTHRISSLYLTPDQRTLVTGCADGQIITWTVQPGTLEVPPSARRAAPRGLRAGRDARALGAGATLGTV